VHRYWRIEEVLRELEVDRDFIRLLETEDIIHPKHTLEGELVLSAEDVERVRVARILMEELEVNLAGVEVVLHLREEIVAMQHQFGDLLEHLVRELRLRVRKE
jgi:MerR family transcriptional regulator/heat shock protein HspR